MPKDGIAGASDPPAGRSHWQWLPSVYYAEGLPYAIVTVVSVIVYTRLGLTNAQATLYTGWLYLPWVIKPLWSPWVDAFKTKRHWVLVMQFCLGASFSGLALTLPTDAFVQYSLAFFWLAAFASATHDVAADGYYLLALEPSDQAWFVGVRNSFYRIAWVSGQGLLVIVAGILENAPLLGQDVSLAWSCTFLLVAAVFVCLGTYHAWALPHVEPTPRNDEVPWTKIFERVVDTFATFFRRGDILIVLAFLLLFRFAEAQIARLTAPFLLDARTKGGLGLDTAEVGFAVGVVGVTMLLLGGLAGGFLAARHGLKHWLAWMVLAINVPNGVYVLLAYTQPANLWLINGAVALEQFGYGFGFTAYVLYMIYIAEGPYKTAHYAICTGFMALGMMLPGMFSGLIQETLGYRHFFVWVMVATVPSFAVAWCIPLHDRFGRPPSATR